MSACLKAFNSCFGENGSEQVAQNKQIESEYMFDGLIIPKFTLHSKQTSNSLVIHHFLVLSIEKYEPVI